MKNNYLVYVHTNKINGKVYVGKTNSIKTRWSKKGNQYKPRSENKNLPFWNAIVKYGWDNFSHEILVENLTSEEAIEEEIKYIKLYRATESEYGYNVSAGGNGGLVYKVHPKGMLGKKHSDEKKQTQSELMKKLNEEGKCGAVWKDGHPKGMLGKTHSEEYKQRLREENVRGKHPSAKKVKATLPNGDVVFFDCAKDARDYFEIGGVFYKVIKSGNPYEIPKSCTCKEKMKKFEGVKLEYIENTEVTIESNDSVAP